MEAGDVHADMGLKRKAEEEAGLGDEGKDGIEHQDKRPKLDHDPSAHAAYATFDPVHHQEAAPAPPVPTGPLSGTFWLRTGRFHNPQGIMALVEKEGGQWAKSLTKKVTHVLAESYDINRNASLRTAAERNLPIIVLDPSFEPSTHPDGGVAVLHESIKNGFDYKFKAPPPIDEEDELDESDEEPAPAEEDEDYNPEEADSEDEEDDDVVQSSSDDYDPNGPEDDDDEEEYDD